MARKASCYPMLDSTHVVASLRVSDAAKFSTDPPPSKYTTRIANTDTSTFHFVACVLSSRRQQYFHLLE